MAEDGQDIVSLHGRVEMIDGQLMLRIPLDAGGRTLAPLATGIGVVDGDFLIVALKPKLAEMLRMGVDSWVYVDNENGKFTITRSEANDQ